MQIRDIGIILHYFPKLKSLKLALDIHSIAYCEDVHNYHDIWSLVSSETWKHRYRAVDIQERLIIRCELAEIYSRVDRSAAEDDDIKRWLDRMSPIYYQAVPTTCEVSWRGLDLTQIELAW